MLRRRIRRDPAARREPRGVATAMPAPTGQPGFTAVCGARLYFPCLGQSKARREPRTYPVSRTDVEHPWHSNAGLRNVVAHEYFRVDPDMIRDIVGNQLAPLLEDVG